MLPGLLWKSEWVHAGAVSGRSRCLLKTFPFLLLTPALALSPSLARDVVTLEKPPNLSLSCICQMLMEMSPPSSGVGSSTW